MRSGKLVTPDHPDFSGRQTFLFSYWAMLNKYLLLLRYIQMVIRRCQASQGTTPTSIRSSVLIRSCVTLYQRETTSARGVTAPDRSSTTSGTRRRGRRRQDRRRRALRRRAAGSAGRGAAVCVPPLHRVLGVRCPWQPLDGDRGERPTTVRPPKGKTGGAPAGDPREQLDTGVTKIKVCTGHSAHAFRAGCETRLYQFLEHWNKYFVSTEPFFSNVKMDGSYRIGDVQAAVR